MRLDSFFDLNETTDSLAGAALRQQKSAELDRKLFGLVIPAPTGPKPVAAGPVHGFVRNQAGEQVGRLGTQVWSPRYQYQLLTVMLEKDFINEQSVELQLQDGTYEKAIILPLPFDFTAAGIAVA